MLPSLLVLAACEGPPPACVSKDAQITHDPDSDRYAVSEKRYCHGSNDPLAIVRVGRTSRPGEEVEVFVAHISPAALISPTWIGRAKLEIAHTASVAMVKHVTRVEGTAISYRVTERFQLPAVR